MPLCCEHDCTSLYQFIVTTTCSLIDDENKVDIVIDKDIMNSEYYGCSDSTTTGYIKIRMIDIFDKILPYSKHIPKVIEM